MIETRLQDKLKSGFGGGKFSKRWGYLSVS